MNPSRIEEAAAAWVVAHDRGLTAAEQDAFSEWLAADPRHRPAYQEQLRAWREFDLLEQWRPRHSRAPNPEILDGSLLNRLKRQRRWIQSACALAACLVVAAGAGYLALQRGGEGGVDVAAETVQPDWRVSAEETRYVSLPDRSEIDLNEGTELIVRYTASRRHIEIVRGEAYFTVAKDPTRPFDVTVGDTTVRAVGTQFAVRYGGDRVAVVVSEGQVIFGAAAAVEKAQPGAVIDGTVNLHPGDYSEWVLGAQNTLPEVRELPEAQSDQLLSWKPEVLDFVSTPLASVVDEFNRRNTTRITLADGSLAPLPIVASFRANNVNGFVKLLEVTGVARARRVSEDHIELSAP